MKLSEILQDETGALSSKRTGFFVGLLLFVLLFVVNLFTGKVVTETLMDYNLVLLLAGLGSIVAENHMTYKNRKLGIMDQKAEPAPDGPPQQ